MSKDGSLLDEYFGPRATVAYVQNNVQKYNWRCEEGLARWLTWFCDCTDLQEPRDQSTRSFWYKWGRNFIQEFGENQEFTKQVIHYMDTRVPRLLISSPKSLMNVARNMRRKRHDPDDDTQKYTKGWFDE